MDSGGSTSEPAPLRRRLPPLADDGLPRNVTVFATIADDYAASSSAPTAIATHDAAGRPLVLG
jgi:hypothetical protein